MKMKEVEFKKDVSMRWAVLNGDGQPHDFIGVKNMVITIYPSRYPEMSFSPQVVKDEKHFLTFLFPEVAQEKIGSYKPVVN